MTGAEDIEDRFQQEVAARIKKTRLRRGLKQSDFAKLGYSVRHYQKIERGHLNFTLKSLVKVARALDADVTDFLKPEREMETLYRDFFFGCPFGVIVWRLPDAENPDSICLHEHNQYGARAVYRDLANAKGRRMLEIFPKAKDQMVLPIVYDVITTGKSRFIPELIRYDKDFPFTVFSTNFVKCGPDLAAAIFIDITQDFLVREKIKRNKFVWDEANRSPEGEEAYVAKLKAEVNEILLQMGRPPKYEMKGS